METRQMPDRKVIRLQGYDYSLPGNYFVTIVTQDRHCLFGNVEQGEMRTNDAGRAVEQAMEEIPEVHANTMMPHCVVMPNHIHFIITLLGGVSLSEIIRRFKSYTTHLYIEGVKNSGWPRFNRKLWQHNYYEHVIRNQHAYDYIAAYVANNPARWNKDAINPWHDSDKDEIMKQVLMYG